MADGAHGSENDSHPGKKRPDQAIYRPGMFKRGFDLTQTQPRPENHPPPSERRLQQQLRKQQERERDERIQQRGEQQNYQGQRNNSQYRSLPPTSRGERPYRDNVSQNNGYPGRTFNRGRGGGGGGGGFRPRDPNFDTRSVRSGRKQNNYRQNKNKFPSDTQSEMGGNNDDAHSIASTNFSTDTTIYNNGFASELNSRNPSIQSLLSQDIQSFDWADLMADEEDRAASQLAKLPETDSNGNQEDDLSSERTGASTPRKLSLVDHQSTIDRNVTTTQRPLLSTTNEEKIPPVEEAEEIYDLTKKIEQLETKENEENHIKPSTSAEEEPSTPIAEKQPFAEVSNLQEGESNKYLNEKVVIRPSHIDAEDDSEATSLRHSIQKSITCLNQLQERLQAVFRQSVLPEVNEAEMISYLKESSDCFNASVNKIIALKANNPSSSEDFKKCALDAMKVRVFAEKAVQLLAVRKHNYVLTFVTDITMKALYVVSALIVYDLEQAKKFQLIEAFEAIWQKLISRVKMQITSFGKSIVMQLITLIRSSITTVTEQLEFEKQIGELTKAILNTDFTDFTQAIHVSSPSVVTEIPPVLLTFAGHTYRWHGDLARYQSMILGSSDYNPSLKFYFLSFVLDPHSGTALNQMGAVASYKEPSELLNAVFLFCHALTTSKPFTGCESKLLSLLNSPFENGHDADPNTERLEFVQHFLQLAKKAFTGEEDDLQLIVDKVVGTLSEHFHAKNEMNVFTSADFIYQTGILWSLIRMDRVKAEQKDYLKQMLVKYIELLGGSLLNTQEIADETSKSKIAFITSSLALMTELWPHIGGGKLPGISSLHDFEKHFPQIDSPSHIILPEFLLIFHGDPEFIDSNFLTPHSASVETNNAATVIRLNIIRNFFQKYSN